MKNQVKTLATVNNAAQCKNNNYKTLFGMWKRLVDSELLSLKNEASILKNDQATQQDLMEKIESGLLAIQPSTNLKTKRLTRFNKICTKLQVIACTAKNTYVEGAKYFLGAPYELNFEAGSAIMGFVFGIGGLISDFILWIFKNVIFMHERRKDLDASCCKKLT